MKYKTEQKIPSPLLTILLATTLGSPLSLYAESDLLKQAIYAEETEGDLPKAIKLYKKEIQTHANKSDSSQEWASALLQLAKCQLRLGQIEKARIAAHQITKKLEKEASEFQEARTFLASLEPKKFHKVTLPIFDNDHTQGSLLDLDTGRVTNITQAPVEERNEVSFFEKQGVDLAVQFMGDQKEFGIIGLLAQVEQHYWDELPDYAEIDKILAKLRSLQPPTDKVENCEYHPINEDINFPVTYLFRSKSHATGAFQILSIDKEAQEMSIQYQLVPRILEGEALKEYIIGRWSTLDLDDGLNFEADGTYHYDEGPYLDPRLQEDHGTYKIQGKSILVTVPKRPEMRLTVLLQEAKTIFELQSGDKKKELTAIRTPYILTPEQKMQKAEVQVPVILGLLRTISEDLKKKDQQTSRKSIDTFLRKLRAMQTLLKNTELDGMTNALIPQVEQLREAVTKQNWEEAQKVWEGISAAVPSMEKMLQE